MVYALKLLDTRKIVHANINRECWLVTSRNEERLTDFSWAQNERRVPSDYSDRRPHHHWLAPEVLIESAQLTFAADAQVLVAFCSKS
jgi:hypothetical protein